jgi:cytochrome c-type biogenesis protein CcmF
MIVELGHFALILALMTSITQAVVPMIGAAKNDVRWMAFGDHSALVQFLLVAASFGCLTYAYVTSDFSVVNVIQNSHSAKPMLYKVSGVWGNHEGSMLLWVLILAVFGAAVALFGTYLPPALKARALAVQALVAVGFYLFILLTSNPFQRVFPPAVDGEDLNPLLQDPGLAIHPPFLYLGYVGFSMAFSFAIAALIEGRVDAAWARWVRPWTLAAWSFLTIGIALGSWWAYYELGWGGFWFWDPVENASFMPWLVGTALLHSCVVVEKRDTMKAWTVLLAIIAFSFSLLGTFLVRSGVLTSVHAFATDPERGVFILVILLIVIGGSLTLYAWRAPMLKSTGLFQPISREGALLLNNLLMGTAAAVVLLGTLYPLFIDAISDGRDKISVGAPFFNAVFIPLMTPMVVAMAVGPLLPWKRGDVARAFKTLWLAALVAIGAALFVLWWQAGQSPWGIVGFAIAAWLVAGTLTELAERIRLFRIPVGDSLRRLVGLPRAAWGMSLAHLGLALAVAGMTGAGAWKVESVQTMAPGDTVNVAGYEFRFDGAELSQGPNYVSTFGHFTVFKDGRQMTRLDPEKRIYTVRQMPTTEAAIYTMLSGDLYAVIGDPQQNGGFVTRIYFNPLVVWMWIGALTMVLGGIMSLSDRRFRVGAPARTRGHTGPTPAPAE